MTGLLDRDSARAAKVLRSQDEDQVLAGRARFKFYRDRGYAIRNHDLSAEARR